MIRIYGSHLTTLLLVVCVTLSGCNRRTPEERLAKAIEFYQQNDSLSAEVEARKIIEKSPQDPAALQARMLLAQIYVRDNRLDEAVAELEPALEMVSQKDQTGRKILAMYLEILQRQKKFPEALKVVDKYQQQYASDEATSLNLVVKRADLQTLAGETTAARQILAELSANTTTPAELSLYRHMTAQTYRRDRNTTSLIEFFERELATSKEDRDRRGILLDLAEAHARLQNFEKSREFTSQATELYDKGLADELDLNVRTNLMLELAGHYATVGNLAGARRVYQALFDSELRDAQTITATVMGLGDVLLRQGEYDAVIGFLKEAATRYPTAPFGQQAAQMEAIRAQGRLESQAPPDTSTLVMKYRESELLIPANLPKSDEKTSGTATGDASTTGSAEGDGATTGSAAANGESSAPASSREPNNTSSASSGTTSTVP